MAEDRFGRALSTVTGSRAKLAICSLKKHSGPLYIKLVENFGCLRKFLISARGPISLLVLKLSGETDFRGERRNDA